MCKFCYWLICHIFFGCSYGLLFLQCSQNNIPNIYTHLFLPAWNSTFLSLLLNISKVLSCLYHCQELMWSSSLWPNLLYLSHIKYIRGKKRSQFKGTEKFQTKPFISWTLWKSLHRTKTSKHEFYFVTNERVVKKKCQQRDPQAWFLPLVLQHKESTVAIIDQDYFLYDIHTRSPSSR